MQSKIHIKIGTRESPLAMWQTKYVSNLLNEHNCTTEIIPVITKGDKILDREIGKIGSKGVFTEELEQKLKNGEIDIAIHSAKDMPTTLEQGLEIIAFTKREKVNDVLLSLTPQLHLNKESKIVVGTSSVRRVAFLKRYYPNITLKDVRGNLQTRVKKMKEGGYDALMLAYAGVKRMDMDKHIRKTFEVNTFIPAVAQGSIAVESSIGMAKELKNKIKQAVNCSISEKEILCERSFLRKMEGGCSIPVFAYANIQNETVEISGGIISLDGKEIIVEKGTGNSKKVKEIGEALAKEVLEKGGRDILDSLHK